MFQNVLLFIHLKMFKIGCMLNIYPLQQTMHSIAVLCDTDQQQFTWEYSCGSHLVSSVGILQLTA